MIAVAVPGPTGAARRRPAHRAARAGLLGLLLAATLVSASPPAPVLLLAAEHTVPGQAGAPADDTSDDGAPDADTSDAAPGDRDGGGVGTAAAPALTTGRGAPHASAAQLSRAAAGLVDVVAETGPTEELRGTGMVLTADGDAVLTNHHVVDRAQRIRVRDLGDGRFYDATVTAIDLAHDLTLLRLRGARNLSTAPLGSSAEVKVGDPVTALGNAGGDNADPVFATGTVTALDQTVIAGGNGVTERLTGMIQGDAPAAEGDSGGPLLDGRGEVIGVTTAGSGPAISGTSLAAVDAARTPTVDATPIDVAKAWVARATAEADRPFGAPDPVPPSS